MVLINFLTNQTIKNGLIRYNKKKKEKVNNN